MDKWAPQLAHYVADGDPDELLTTRFVADLIHVSEVTLEVWRARSRATKKQVGPPFVQVGPHLVRYRRDQLVEWLRSRPTSPQKRRSTKKKEPPTQRQARKAEVK